MIAERRPGSEPRASSTTPIADSSLTTTDSAGSEGARQFDQLLELLGIKPDEPLTVCYQRPGEKFSHRRTTRAKAPALAQAWADEACVWYSTNPIRPIAQYGRGTAYDVTRCAALYADIDLKDSGARDADTVEKIVLGVVTAMGCYATALVSSGHGLHIYWQLDPDDPAWQLDSYEKRSAAQALYRRHYRLVSRIAHQYGAKVDNISDLSRLLRVPGSYNRKNPGDPVPVELWDELGKGVPLTFKQVSEIVADIPEREEDDVLLSQRVLEARDWQFGTTTAYVAEMIRGWESDTPTGARHNWLVSQATRLACAHRLGRISRADHVEGLNALEARFLKLIDVDRYPDPPTEVEDAVSWGRARAEIKTDAGAAEEIGGDDDGLGLNLPESFWERSSMAHIRQAAWSKMLPPDLVLNAILANVSASLLPDVVVDTGILSPLPLHHFAGLVGPVGGSKSAAMKAASRLINTENDEEGFLSRLRSYPHQPDEKIPHRWPLGTGQGILMAFIDDVTEPVPEGAPKGTRPKTRPTQVRTNVLLFSDEGNDLVKSCKDHSSIVGEVLRETWSGSDTGQGNAKIENRRFLLGGQYTLAAVAGFQEGVLADFLAPDEVSKGTPQRFLCTYSIAPDLPKPADRPEHPGSLKIKLPNEMLTVCESLRDQIANEHHAKQTGAVWVEPMDGQRSAMVARVAALLAIIDGRRVVSQEDWGLAAAMQAVSRRICAHVLNERKQKASRARKATRYTEAADQVAIDNLKDHPDGRAALAVLKHIPDDGGTAKWTGTDGIRTRKFKGERRAEADRGLVLLESLGLVIVEKSGSTTMVKAASE
jgi:hypothetical protein